MPHTTRSKKKGITSISVAGVKSIGPEQSIAVGPLTLLAGANSSGKSSIMQPLLLLKQTVDASFDPGPLMLTGPNVKFTSAKQLLCRIPGMDQSPSFSAGYAIEAGESIKILFERQRGNQGFKIREFIHTSPKNGKSVLRPEMTHDELISGASGGLADMIKYFRDSGYNPQLSVERDRCFLRVSITADNDPFGVDGAPGSRDLYWQVKHLIHVPGLRGNPERTYARTAVQSTFPGTFDQYVASIITQWQDNRDKQKLDMLSQWLEDLGLTWKVLAKAINDTQVELRVGRLPQNSTVGAKDTVSIADVGFGVSEILPVLVALLTATPGQLVYVEQPELHLHPKAQVRLAPIFAWAAKRGVRTIIETHSSLLLRAIQLEVVRGDLDHRLVKLNWFQRDTETGLTQVSVANMSDVGAYGDWPVDFEDVAIKVETDFLDAVERKVLGNDDD